MARNQIQLIGRLTADPELRYTDGGTPVADFSIAVNRFTPKADSSKGYDTAFDGFFDCELYGGQAVSLAESCAKGDELQLVGSLRQNKFKTKGDNPRTVSRVLVRVDSAARVLEVKRDQTQAAPTEEAVAPAPAPPPQEATAPAPA